MAVRTTVAIDVSGLPTVLYGAKATLWWGIVALIAIEGMAFALSVATYFYLRLQEARWPPEGWAAPALTFGTANLALMIISAGPMRRVEVEGRRLNKPLTKLWMSVWLIMAAVMLVARFLEFSRLHVKWDSNAYGSVVWVILALHTLHLVSSFGESAVLAVYLFTHPLDPKHALDLQINAVYWYFIVLSWILLYGLLYWGPVFLN